MVENIKAIVSIKIGNDFFTLKNIISQESVDELYETSGEYDALAIISVPLEKLNSAIDKIKYIKGVTATSTILVLKEIQIGT